MTLFRFKAPFPLDSSKPGLSISLVSLSIKSLIWLVDTPWLLDISETKAPVTTAAADDVPSNKVYSSSAQALSKPTPGATISIPSP